MTISPTFRASVPNVGDFTFRKRSIRDQLWIEAEQLRVLGGATQSMPLRNVAHAIAVISRLLVSAPDGWDLDTLDPLDDGQLDEILKVYEVLRRAENDFRRVAGKIRAPVGP